MEQTTNYNTNSPSAESNIYPQSSGVNTAAGNINSSGPAANNISLPQAQSGYNVYPQSSYSLQGQTNSTMTQNTANSGMQNMAGNASSNISIPSTSVLPYSPYSTDSAIQYQAPAQSGIRTIQPLNMPLQNNENTPETLTNPIYIPGFLRQNIGRWMRVEFLIGNTMTDRVGVLTEVGASYILLHSIDPNSYILCDMFSIKFVVIINTDNYGSLFIDQ